MAVQHPAPADAGGPPTGSASPARRDAERHRRCLAARRGAGESPLVLVVEDDDNVRAALQALLEAGGYRVAATALGEEAVRLAPVLRPDVVLMDLVLPGGSGMDAVRFLREDRATAGIPVIAMTALWLAEHPATLAAAGFDGALRKPYTGAELFAELERVLAAGSAPGETGVA